MKIILLSFLIIVSTTIGFSQMWVDGCPQTDLYLEVFEVNGSDVTFEIRLKQASTSMCGSFGLGNADFVLDFNNAAFTAPALSLVPGFFNLVDKTGTSSFVLEFVYVTQSAISVIGAAGSQQLVFNINGPVPTTPSSFDQGVAIIDDTQEWVYGRFTVSGYDGISPLGLDWAVPKFGGNNPLATGIFGIEDDDFDGDGVSFLSVDVIINSSSVLLDLELSDFTAAAYGSTHSKLNWETATESDMSHFVVQRTLNGNNWSDVGTVQAQGNSNSSVNYSFIDRNAYTLGTGKVTYYYRLKSIDLDGTFEFSDTEAVVFNSKAEAGGVSIQPNPAFDYIEIGLSKDVTALYDVTYQLIDVSGRSVLEGQFSDNYERLDIRNVATGMYFISILHDGVKQLEPQKVVIARH